LVKSLLRFDINLLYSFCSLTNFVLVTVQNCTLYVAFDHDAVKSAFWDFFLKLVWLKCWRTEV